MIFFVLECFRENQSQSLFHQAFFLIFKNCLSKSSRSPSICHPQPCPCSGSVKLKNAFNFLVFDILMVLSIKNNTAWCWNWKENLWPLYKLFHGLFVSLCTYQFWISVSANQEVHDLCLANQLSVGWRHIWNLTRYLSIVRGWIGSHLTFLCALVFFDRQICV